MTQRELVFASYLAPNIRPVYEFVADRVSLELGVPTRLVTARSFDQLRTGEVHFAFLCGLPYVRLRQEAQPLVEALAAPVVQGSRYQGRPIYFSDVIVAATSTVRTFEELRGASWAYNEPDSHSGYMVTLYRLWQLGETGAFFGDAVMTGFHQESIRRVASGKIDASAIDSQVLAVELRDNPALRARVRVVDALGPSTIQPLVATAAVPDTLKDEVRSIVTGLGTDERDRQVLMKGLVSGFVAVQDDDYDDIRAMVAAVDKAGIGLARAEEDPASGS